MSKLESPPVRIVASPDARRLAELARVAGLGDSPADALKWNRESLALLADSGETSLLADVLRWQGSVLRDCGRTAAAEPLYDQSLAVARRIDYRTGIAHALNCLASIAQRRGDIACATTLVNDALGIAERCGEQRMIAMMHQNLGMLADIRGDSVAALAHYGFCLETFEAANEVEPLCWVLNNVGVLQLKAQRFDDAASTFRRALGLARSRGDLMGEGVVEENRAELALIEGTVDEAYAPLSRALEIAEQRGDDLRRAAALKLRGAYQRLSGRPAEAVDTLRYALTLSAVSEDALLAAEVLYQFGLALFEDGQNDSANGAWTAALDAFQRIAARDWIIRVSQRLRSAETGRYL
jgi:tetratricopeptide (TPR) repeat protein